MRKISSESPKWNRIGIRLARGKPRLPGPLDESRARDIVEVLKRSDYTRASELVEQSPEDTLVELVTRIRRESTNPFISVLVWEKLGKIIEQSDEINPNTIDAVRRYGPKELHDYILVRLSAPK